ncbi:hypothetical protein [Candidatus Carsonella ruddii]|uniref:Uncharacterized protein n=1 Tax=Carsonella ruddii TaxID=114186 RepID=A0A1U9RSB0_CARRU|nr:hypothetical protein [Candidatus Carsonella ruddii]AQU89563.1 hypothetical protein BW244_0145 [Candidatus Carsonella ruddii]
MEKLLIKKFIRKIKNKKFLNLNEIYSFFDKKINNKKLSSKYKSKYFKYVKFA